MSTKAQIQLVVDGGPVPLNQYNRPEDPGIDFSNEQKITKDSFKDECDINNIIRRFLKGGTLPDFVPGVYADVTQYGDFREVRERIRLADEYFDTLPAEIRERFNNDTASLLEAVADPNRKEELQQLGLFPGDEIISDAPGATPPTPPPVPPAPSTGAGTPPKASNS